MGALDRAFRLKERGTDVQTELLAGATTFMTLSYIIFVQPVVMSETGMDAGAVMVATCVASAIACVVMALTTNYPIALAPAMGHNFFFSLVVCKLLGFTWQEALAAVFISGSIFVALGFFGFRARIMDVIPDNLKHAIAGGIGLLIALVGLEYAGIVVGTAGTWVGLGQLKNPYTMLALFGLGVTLALYALRLKGAILLGIVLTAAAGLATGLLDWHGVQHYKTLDASKTLFKMDFAGLFTHGIPEGQPVTAGAVLANLRTPLSVILVFLFLDVFDTVGTLIGVSERAGLLVDGRLPKARWALFSDAVGTVVGACMGTSTITSYVESAAGVQAGGRTGLTSLTTALLLVAALLAYPFLGVISSAHLAVLPALPTYKATLYPVIAPSLILIGAMMLQGLKSIRWDDPTEYVPAFMTLIIMPLTVNITEGIAFGFITYSLLKLVTGRLRDSHWGIHVLSVILLLRYVFLSA